MSLIQAPKKGNGLLDTVLTIGSMFIPGVGPWVAGAKALGSLLSGNPENALIQAAGAFAPTKGASTESVSPSGFSAPNLSAKMNSIGPSGQTLTPDLVDGMNVNNEIVQARNAQDEAQRINTRYNQLVKQYGYGDNPETDWTARQQMNKGNPVVDQTLWNDLLTRYKEIFGGR
jgi:hypothetical protein